ncbi:uncharacterized protein KY384_008029 [Bacidia gigantensis]|uniref:uncharacterized protein n=1 Tax=Bacidia gigantensis TaxID=2732470 RepID=UPI001D046DB0|nr:uncharacterized protein KY384_008029 [Bacidia gigantensis]KAG8527285.1 hypothetical protein KY384_008029 [Bacidia gigantensis]
MRLLHTTKLELFDFLDNEIPPYAILSHTWGEDEVSYADFLTGKRNAKILRGCELIASESWEYVWIDTCCIDKSSRGAELSEAINSMYRWYQKSETCYVHLSDIHVKPRTSTKPKRFVETRWFTRGWTLQELLAPKRVVFFDSCWVEIGSKTSLSDAIFEATRIEPEYLTSPDTMLQDASAAMKMSWASKRETSRVEDIAYCLLGLFNVNMPLLYGEGERAFQRLQHEIIGRSSDESIFAWTDRRPVIQWEMFAAHPSAFEKSGDIIRSANDVISRKGTLPYALTNKGLQIHLPVVGRKESHLTSDEWELQPIEDDDKYAEERVALACRRRSQPGTCLGIRLSNFSDGGSLRLRFASLQTYQERERPLKEYYVKTHDPAHTYIRRCPFQGEVEIFMTPAVEDELISVDDVTHEHQQEVEVCNGQIYFSAQYESDQKVTHEGPQEVGILDGSIIYPGWSSNMSRRLAFTFKDGSNLALGWRHRSELVSCPSIILLQLINPNDDGATTEKLRMLDILTFVSDNERFTKMYNDLTQQLDERREVLLVLDYNDRWHRSLADGRQLQITDDFYKPALIGVEPCDGSSERACADSGDRLDDVEGIIELAGVAEKVSELALD